MGFIGDIAKTILLTWIVFWVIAMMYLFATGQMALALLFLVGLLIPLSFMTYKYWQYKKK
jgi:hypothetical protein